MDRKEELLEVFENSGEKIKKTVLPLLDHMVYLEETLDYLKTLPSVRVNPDNPSIQKATISGKQYKDYLQQYLNVVKTILGAIGVEGETGDLSDLDKWLKERMKE